MVALRTLLLITNGLLFMIVGFVLLARVKEAKGSLRLAKASVVLAAFSAAGTFLTESISATNYENEVLVKQLYVFQDLSAMLVLAFLSSFAILATYADPKRKWFIALFFLLALMPPLYLVTSWSQAQILSVLEPEVIDFQAPPLTYLLYAVFGIPLGLIPVIGFARSFLSARKRGDHVLSNRSALMLSAVVANEGVYVVYVFGTGLVELIALSVWIPAQFLLLYAVLRITSPLRSQA